MVAKSGIYDLTAAEYHADPVDGGSLSSTGARRLLPPGCPALYRYWLEHPPEPSAAMNFGKAAHAMVLGAGPYVMHVNATNYQTKNAREVRDAAKAAGWIPMLDHEYQVARDMAAAIRAHPMRRLLYGRPETTIVWTGDGITKRAMLDVLPPTPKTGRLIITDYKTCTTADRDAIQRSIARYGYHQQAAWYLDGVRALGLGGDDTAFLFLFQETRPPYLVVPVELDPVALQIGRARNQQAVEIYRHCNETGVWPGHVAGDEIQMIGLPPYVENRFFEEVQA